jgi:hypothetical protein
MKKFIYSLLIILAVLCASAQSTTTSYTRTLKFFSSDLLQMYEGARIAAPTMTLPNSLTTYTSTLPFGNSDNRQLYNAIRGIGDAVSGFTNTSWNLTGNSVSTNTNFIGTTSNRSLLFKTNNIQRLKIDSLGKLTHNGYSVFTSTGTPTSGEPNYFVSSISDLIGNQYNVRSTYTVNSTNNNSSYRIGAVLGEVYLPSTNTGTLGYAVGNYGYIQNFGNNLLRSHASYNIVTNRGTGTVTEQHVGVFESENSGGGYIADNVGVYIHTPSNSSGTIATNTGLFIEPQNVGNRYRSMTINGGSDTAFFRGHINAATTITTPEVYSPLIIGGKSVGSTLNFRSTTDNGTGSGSAFVFQGGNNGNTEILRMLNDGTLRIPLNRVIQGTDALGTNRSLITWSGGENILLNGRPGVSDIILNPTAAGVGLYVKSTGQFGLNTGTPASNATVHIAGTMSVSSTSTLTGLRNNSTFTTTGATMIGGTTAGSATLHVLGTFSASSSGTLAGVLSTSSVVSTSKTAGIGYAVGSGSTVTQGTSRTTGVTINDVVGSITLFNTAGSATWQSFTMTNSTIGINDVIIVSQRSGTDLYMIEITAVAAGSCRISFATTGGTTSEAPVFNFAVIKGATN